MITVLMVVLWLAGSGKAQAMAVVVPPDQDCGSVAVAYFATHVTGNPNVMNAAWSCFDVPEPEKEKAS
jgi:hypothetical protein